VIFEKSHIIIYFNDLNYGKIYTGAVLVLHVLPVLPVDHSLVKYLEAHAEATCVSAETLFFLIESAHLVK
jgi:hypothetical protein